MKFIKLTDIYDNTPFYVNIAAICSIFTNQDEDTILTIVTLNNGQRRLVLEKPEKIMEMIDNALHEKQ